MSSREAPITLLHAAMSTTVATRRPEPQGLRGETVPQPIGAGGLIDVQDDEAVEETAILWPLRWQNRHVAEIVVAAVGPTPEARAVSLDAPLVDVADAVVVHRALGGAVDWAQPGSLSFDTLDFDGAVASVPVSKAFRHRYPDVSLRSVPLVTTGQIEAPRDDAIDIGFLTGRLQRGDLLTRVVQTDKLVAVIPEGHPLSGTDPIAVGALAKGAFVVGEQRH